MHGLGSLRGQVDRLIGTPALKAMGVTLLIIDLLQMRKNFAQLAARITYRLDLE